MDAHTLEATAAGVFMRRYRRTLDPLPEATRQHCVSLGAASRRSAASSSKRMHEFLPQVGRGAHKVWSIRSVRVAQAGCGGLEARIVKYSARRKKRHPGLVRGAAPHQQEEQP